MRVIRAELKNEFVFCNVPIANGVIQGFFKDHNALFCPDLKQEPLVVIISHYRLIYDFEKYWAKISISVIIATCKDSVEALEGYFEHHILHEFLGRLELVFTQFMFLVSLLNF